VGGYTRYARSDADNIIPQEIVELRGAVFLQAQWNPLEEIQLTGGLRYDLNSQTDGVLSPRAVAVFRFWSDHAFRLSYGMAFRKPAFIESRMHIEIDEAAFPEIIEKFTTSIGNEDLGNEKVHSIEVGWRAQFLEETLKVSVDLFYNIYEDMIYFEPNLFWDALGRPDILRSTFVPMNRDTSVTAFGGEIEVALDLAESWTFWGNLGLRRVTDEEGKRLESEPSIRINLGSRWSDKWFLVDLALHYVSSYTLPFHYPDEIFEISGWMELGDELLLIARAGYRYPLGESRKLEAGLFLRAPIGGPFREFSGVPMERTTRSIYGSDFGGERIVRLVSLYLRGSF
jgi:outer membrane receptor protein involved in Fe transport